MAERNGAHFSDDEELLSRYALGRLGAAERERVDRHAAGCAACSDALRREMRIAAGVRRLGRDTLKANLKAGAASGSGRSVWPRFASAAAIFLVVGGLGIYFGWLSGRGKIAEEVPGAPPIASGSGAESPGVEKIAPPLADARSAGKPSSLPAPSADQSGERGAAAPPLSPAAERDRRQVDIVGGLAASRAESTLQSDEAGREFWSDGLVDQGGIAAKKAEPQGKVLYQNQEIALDKQKSIKEGADRLKDADTRAQGHFRFLQEPASALPPERKGDARAEQNEMTEADRPRDLRAVGQTASAPAPGPARVPTRVDQRGDTTTMTLYLDSLVEESELKRARVDALGDDSLVVTLGGRKIQYRFPQSRKADQQRAK